MQKNATGNILGSRQGCNSTTRGCYEKSTWYRLREKFGIWCKR